MRFFSFTRSPVFTDKEEYEIRHLPEAEGANRMKKSLGKVLAVATLSGLSLLNVGCEQEADRTMASAQACMDRATTPAQANACAAKVEGIETPSAYLIRCSANFIAQGFTGKRIADAYQGMTDSGSSSGSDPMIGMISYLVFQTDAVNGITQTLSNCTKSGTTSMLRLAEVANLATTMASINGAGNLVNFDPTGKDATQLADELKDVLTNIGTDPAKEATIGTVAIQMSGSVCAAGSSLATTEVCTYLGNALSVGNGDAEATGEELIRILKQKAGI
jgi:hypothetical protein